MVGATISGRTLNFPTADGGSIAINLPADMDTQDGVVSSGSFSADGMMLNLVLEDGTEVHIPVPELFRGAGLSEAVVNDLIAAAGHASATDVASLDARVAALEGVPPGMHLRYFGFSADRSVMTAEFADASSSMTDEGTLPANTDAAYPYFAVPETVGAPDSLLFPPNPVDQLSFYQRQDDTVDDTNGDPHIVYIGFNQLPPGGVRAVNLIYN